MPAYSLRFSDDSCGGAKRIDFEASDAVLALGIVKAEATHRRAELWDSVKILCTIRHEGDDFWRLNDRI